MKVRALDNNGDWTFGKGLSGYIKDADCVAQNIQTRVLMWLNDCFFSSNQGVDYVNLLDKGQELNLDLAIRAEILGANGVIQLNELSINLDHSVRSLSVSYSVDTIFGNVYKSIVAQGAQ